MPAGPVARKCPPGPALALIAVAGLALAGCADREAQTAATPTLLGQGLGTDDGSDSCRPQAEQLRGAGSYFLAGLATGAAVGAGAAALVVPRGPISGLIFLGSLAAGAAAGAVADDYLARKRREAGSDPEALAQAVATDLEREGQGLEGAQYALDQLIDCRLGAATALREAEAAGTVASAESGRQRAGLRRQAERDLALAREIRGRVEARAAEFDRAIDAVAPGARETPPPAPQAVLAAAPAPVPLRARPEPAAAPLPALPPDRPVQVRPARTLGFVAVETPSGQRLGYAPATAFPEVPPLVRAVPVPGEGAAPAPSGAVRRLAATNIARRDNFVATVADLEAALAGPVLEPGT